MYIHIYVNTLVCEYMCADICIYMFTNMYIYNIYIHRCNINIY